MSDPNKVEIAVQAVSHTINNMSFNPKEFVTFMGQEHRTLQQSFTRLCIAWIEHCADPKYRFDLRNEDSHELGQFIMKALNERDNGYYLRSI